MKISKKTLLITSGMLSISALGLMFVSAAERELFMDVHNAIQHIDTIKIISTGSYGSAILSNTNNGLVKIETNNFILGGTGNNNMIADSGSSILGGESNEIIGSYNVIIGGSGNTSKGTHNTIIGGESNTFTGFSSYNTIVGGKNNQIIGGNNINDTNKSNHNVIIGGHDNTINRSKYSVIMGNNSSVKGDNSFALGSGSHIEANNSFLWTDGNYPETLKANDVFVIMAQSGAIINSGSAHRFAKLTLGGPLVLSNSNNQSDIQCGGGEGGGIIKMEKSDKNQLCLCSCDGSGWNSMFSYGACLNVCTPTQPECGTEINRICENGITSYSGSCINGNVVEGTGAYFVDKNNIVHRTCQSKDGSVDFCSGSVIGGQRCEPNINSQATLTYNANNCGTAPDPVTMTYGAATYADSMTATNGRTFTKWCTQSNGNGTCYTVNQTVKAANTTPTSMTLYAQCTAEPTATLTYSGNNCGVAPDSVTMTYGAETKAATSMKIINGGRTLLKRCTESNAGGICYDRGAVVKESNKNPTAMTLYAICQEPDNGCVNYDEYGKCNGGIISTPARGPDLDKVYWMCGSERCETCNEELGYTYQGGKCVESSIQTRWRWMPVIYTCQKADCAKCSEVPEDYCTSKTDKMACYKNTGQKTWAAYGRISGIDGSLHYKRSLQPFDPSWKNSEAESTNFSCCIWKAGSCECTDGHGNKDSSKCVPSQNPCKSEIGLFDTMVDDDIHTSMTNMEKRCK